MAKTFEVYTMNGSGVMAKIAGMESTAKIRSVNSTTSSASSSGVIIHVPAATSDGDVIVFFRESDVVVTGGVIEDLTYPVIRLDEGGSINGTLEALNDVLDLTIAEYRAQGGTMVIPNRGRIYDEGDVAEYRDMLTIVRDRVQDAIAKGQTLEQIQAARLARDYDGRYAAASGPASADAFITTVYRSLTAAE